MSVGSALSHEADQAARRYAALVEVWRGVYAGAVSAADFGSARALARAREAAHAAARTYLETERALITVTLPGVAHEAHRNARVAARVSDALALPEPTGELLSATQSYLESELAAQVARDIALLLRRLRGAALEIGLAAQVQGTPFRTAAIQWCAHRGDTLRFHVADRRGRKWPSQSFVRAAWRQTLLDVYNLSVLETLAEQGIDHAVVRHPSPDGAVDGLVVALLPGTDHATYAEIRDEVFHPNSDAVLARPEAV